VCLNVAVSWEGETGRLDVVMFGLGFEVFLVFFQRKPFCFDEALITRGGRHEEER
jgi:hypothetical protein